MKEQLPNLRLFGAESSEWGSDWSGIAKEIDQKIEDFAYELATQDIFIEFNQWPDFPQVRVFRSVIGPLKVVPSPFILVDWESRQVDVHNLNADNWTTLFQEISTLRTDLDLSSNFTLRFSRKLNPQGLSFNKQVLFR